MLVAFSKLFALVAICLLLGSVWTQPVHAIALGDELPSTTESSQPSLRKAVLKSGSVQVTAFANEKNRVYRLEIVSQEELPPDPAPYLGSYASVPAETIASIPMRGRILRYSDGSRLAEWSVFGMSGDFSAVAASQDLAPATDP